MKVSHVADIATFGVLLSSTLLQHLQPCNITQERGGEDRKERKTPLNLLFSLLLVSSLSISTNKLQPNPYASLHRSVFQRSCSTRSPEAQAWPEEPKGYSSPRGSWSKTGCQTSPPPPVSGMHETVTDSEQEVVAAVRHIHWLVGQDQCPTEDSFR